MSICQICNSDIKYIYAIYGDSSICHKCIQSTQDITNTISRKVAMSHRIDTKTYSIRGTITTDYIKTLLKTQKYRCYICDTIMSIGKWKPQCLIQFSISRLLYDKKHDIDNTILCCYYCNRKDRCITRCDALCHTIVPNMRSKDEVPRNEINDIILRAHKMHERTTIKGRIAQIFSDHCQSVCERNHTMDCTLCPSLKRAEVNIQINRKITTTRRYDLSLKSVKDDVAQNDIDVLYIKLLILRQNAKCYICDTPVLLANYEPYCNYQFSIDRILNTLPHCRSNIAISCLLCNIKTSTHRGYAKYKQCKNGCHVMSDITTNKSDVKVSVIQEVINDTISTYEKLNNLEKLDRMNINGEYLYEDTITMYNGKIYKYDKNKSLSLSQKRNKASKKRKKTKGKSNDDQVTFYDNMICLINAENLMDGFSKSDISKKYLSYLYNLQSGKCHVCEDKLDFNTPKKCYYRPLLSKINRLQKYKKGNIVFTCEYCWNPTFYTTKTNNCVGKCHKNISKNQINDFNDAYNILFPKKKRKLAPRNGRYRKTIKTIEFNISRPKHRRVAPRMGTKRKPLLK
jgi:hypothetical protein